MCFMQKFNPHKKGGKGSDVQPIITGSTTRRKPVKSPFEALSPRQIQVWHAICFYKSVIGYVVFGTTGIGKDTIMDAMGWLAWIIVGALSGWLASIVMRTDHGLLLDIVVGIVGAFIVGLLFSFLRA